MKISLRTQLMAALMGAALFGILAPRIWLALASPIAVGVTDMDGVLLFMGVALLLSHRVVRYLLAPLDLLLQAAKKITADPAAMTLIPVQTAKEVQQLAQAINALCRGMAQVNQTADVRVIARTQALALSEKRLKHLVNASTEGFMAWCVDENNLSVTSRCCQLLGLDQQVLSYPPETLINAVPPEEREAMYALLCACLEDDMPFEREMQLMHPDGSEIWVNLSVSVVERTPEGRATHVLGRLTDISLRQVAQAALVDRTDELNAILDLSPDGFVLLDEARKVNYISPAFTRMTHIEMAHVQGLHVTAFWHRFSQCCQADTPGLSMAGVPENTATAGTGARLLVNLERPERRVLAITRQRRQSSQKPLVLFFRDVTHETEVVHLKNKFLVAAAFELRAPLTSIYGFAEILIKNKLDDKFKQEFLEIIYRQSNAMSLLLNDLLDLSRIQDLAANDPVVSNISARALVQQVVASFNRPPERAAPLVCAKAVKLLMNADANKVRQAIFNMLSNAYKFSPDGGDVHIAIDQVAHAEGRPMVAIRVTDHGIGMTAEQITCIFERHYRVNESSRVPGTGLGLCIVKDLAELHGGSVTVESTLGLGTCISLLLPCMAQEHVVPLSTQVA